MKVVVDGWAWLPKSDLTLLALQSIRQALTIIPKQMGGPPDDDEPIEPISLYTETPTHIGVAREYFLNARGKHEVDFQVSEGDKSTWPGPLLFNKERALRAEQQEALDCVLSAFGKGRLGGVVKASPGWGKTTYTCALIAQLNLPTLVVVHKEFLMDQWLERLTEFLPGIQVGIAQQKRCDYVGKHVVVGMVHSLAKGGFPQAFYDWPGFLVVDETHRIGARTWSSVPTLFKAKHRLGVSATPRRKDGAENVFLHHIGPVIFTAKERRMLPIVKRVHSTFKMVRTPSFNPKLAPEALILRFLCSNVPRNQLIVKLMVDAAKAGRKLLILSKRLNHLNTLEAMFHKAWLEANVGPSLTTGYYVGGMTEEARYRASLTRIIFATAQFAAEGLDIPALDTLFLAAPMGDVEQAVGRILRPYQDKKPPIVVDVRDDEVGMFKAYASNRDRQYERMM